MKINWKAIFGRLLILVVLGTLTFLSFSLGWDLYAKALSTVFTAIFLIAIGFELMFS